MPLARWLALVGVACSILVASFAVLSSTSTPARAASSLASTTGVGLTAVQSVGKLGAAMVHNGLQPMAVWQSSLSRACCGLQRHETLRGSPCVMVSCTALATSVGGTGWLTGRPGRLVWLARVDGRRMETDKFRST